MMPFSLSNLGGPWVELFQRGDGLWDWRLVAGNGETVCQTSQGFSDEGDAMRAAKRAQQLMADVTEIRQA